MSRVGGVTGPPLDFFKASSNFRSRSLDLTFSSSALFLNRASRRDLSCSSIWPAWERSRDSVCLAGASQESTPPNPVSTFKLAPQHGHLISICSPLRRPSTIAECYAGRFYLSNLPYPHGGVPCSDGASIYSIRMSPETVLTSRALPPSPAFPVSSRFPVFPSMVKGRLVVMLPETMCA
jgi:hypothetical protein